MALQPDLLRQVQQMYGQRMQGPMGDAAFNDSPQLKDTSNTAAGITGAAALTANLISQGTRNKNINTTSPGQQTDAYGKPTYNLGGFAQGIDAINTKINGGNIANDTAQGAAIGTQILPGWGTAVGAAVGLIGGTASELFASGAAKRKKRLAAQSLFNAQRAYNSQISQYNTTLSGEQQYQDIQNPDARLYNLYRATTPQ